MSAKRKISFAQSEALGKAQTQKRANDRARWRENDRVAKLARAHEDARKALQPAPYVPTAGDEVTGRDYWGEIRENITGTIFEVSDSAVKVNTPEGVRYLYRPTVRKVEA